MAGRYGYNNQTARDVMSRLLGRRDVGRRLTECIALTRWPEAVGPRGAAATEAEGLFNGTLTIRTRSSVWAHELSLHSERLIAEMNRLAGKPVVQRLRFRTEDRPAENPLEPEIVPEPDPGEVEAIALPPDEVARVEAACSEFAGLQDAAFRERIRRRAIRTRKLHIWRMAHGWSACARCGVAHRDANPQCIVCRGAGD